MTGLERWVGADNQRIDLLELAIELGGDRGGVALGVRALLDLLHEVLGVPVCVRMCACVTVTVAVLKYERGALL